ncbi:MAG: carboxypeptidase regulatory-like domain-containing protein [Saprospiraceae bacterium]|nr:carboxypeptidase regulatory-like domain-containing protein [Saprospiraceae bacterium]
MISQAHKSILFLSLFLMISYCLSGQNENAIFSVQKADLNKDVLEYSPLFLSGQWVYTQLENEGVIMYSLGSDVSTPITGFNLRKSNVTGFAKSNQGGLIAISYGDRKTNVPAKLMNNKIWFAYQDKTGFASKYFEFVLNSDQYSCTTPFISPDGTKLYFSSDMPGGYGGFDLYVCDYRGKEWSKPRNLGSKVNSEKDEVYPFLVDDLLFFSSNGHGASRMDIFIADMANDKGRMVINAGVPINSPADDYAMTFDNNTRTGYFLSDRDGVNGKAFKVTNDKKLVLINIKTNEDNSPISGAKLDLSRCRKNPMYANSKGSIILPVPPGEDCYAQVGKVGYNATTFILNYNDITGLKKSIDIFLSQEGVFYKGRVTDLEGNPAPEVELSIIDQATGELQYVYTDDNGYYSIALEPLSFYLIRSKSNYYNTKETKFSTQASVPANILGTIQLQSNGVKPPSIRQAASMDNVKVTEKTNGDGSGSVTDYVETGVAKKIESVKGEETTITEAQKMMDENDKKVRAEDPKISQEQNIQPSVISDSPVIISKPAEEKQNEVVRYAIQLAAISAGNNNIKGFEEQTAGRGQIFIVRENNLNKVRLGFFNSREDAAAVKEKLPEELRKGFIVEVSEKEYNQILQSFKSNSKNSTNETNHNLNAQTSNNDTKPTDNQPVVTTSTPTNIKIEYKVRLSTLQNVKLFDGSKVKKFGLIEEVKNGNLTTFYLSGFENKEEARQAFLEAKNAGFPRAQLIKVVNGEYSVEE